MRRPLSSDSLHRFRLAPMSTGILVLTAVLLALPAAGLMSAALVDSRILVGAMPLLLIYAWVWLRFRPTAFVVRPDAVDVVWPLKRRTLPRSTIGDVQVIDRRELRRRIGFGVRVGAGGLWGGFGWLWTRRRGVVRMYVSRVDRFVWMECSDGPSWLITPERPDAFARALDVRASLDTSGRG